MDRDKGYTQAILLLRAQIFEILAVGLGLAIGINILAFWIERILGGASLALLAVGLGLTFLPLVAFVVFRRRIALPTTRHLNGLFVVRTESNSAICIDRYPFSEKMCDYLAGLSENPALSRAWRDSSLSGMKYLGDGRLEIVTNTAARQLAREALEYFVLDMLSLHLSGHFENNPRIADDEIVRILREDIPDVLLRNHFLDLFSRPIAERSAFAPLQEFEQGKGVRQPSSTDEHGAEKRIKKRQEDDGTKVTLGHPPERGVYQRVGAVCFQKGKDGAIFDRFELILPAKSRVKRLDPSTISIDTGRFVMRISSEFDGYSANLPGGFEKSYLRLESEGDLQQGPSIHTYSVKLQLSVRFRPFVLLTSKGWEYHRWVDSFLEELQESFSFERFLSKIGWEASLTVARLTQPKQNQKSGPDSSSAETMQ